MHWCTVLMSSSVTISTHLRQGPLSLIICFFTMASNAKSGVNRPVLDQEREGEGWTEDTDQERERERAKAEY